MSTDEKAEKESQEALDELPLLYKYVGPDNTKNGAPRPVRILQTMRLSATDPRTFNDPFEVRPWFDQERHDHYARSHESFYERVLGISRR
jgi:hypothetical protein